MTVKITFYNLSVRLETNDMMLASHIEFFLDKYYTVTEKGFSQAQEDKKNHVRRSNS
jgi:hypothetical protein